MIVDLQRFVEQERPCWDELEAMLRRLAESPAARLNLPDVVRFHNLYERVSADLAQISTFAAERELRRYLESLVARAYGEIHETRRRPERPRPLRWLARTFPQTFRRRRAAFLLSVAATLAGMLFGGAVVAVDPAAREVIMPFEQLLVPPEERVAQEEDTAGDMLEGVKARGAAWYMTHNTRVCLYTRALGMTWGAGTLIMLFYNGVILGGVLTDFVLARQSPFLFGWLLPHGSVEIPAVLIAGQAAFVLAGALIGWGRSLPLGERLRAVAPDVVTLAGGMVLLLVWAGLIESFLSQYHEPVIPYGLKIAFGTVQVVAVTLFLAFAGREPGARPAGTGRAEELA